MKHFLLLVLLITFILFISACDNLPKIDTSFPDKNDTETPFNNSTDNEYILDEQTKLTEELLFSEDFSSSLNGWKISAAPTIIDGALSSESFVIETLNSFSSKNGIEFSFDFRSPSNPTGVFKVTFVEKIHASNYAKFFTITPTGNLGYYIAGYCVTPNTQTHNQAGPIDGNFHTFTFRVHTNGSAEWIQDGYVQFQRNKFDIGGNYTIMLSGSSLIGSSESNVFLDNIEVSSLAEKEAGYKICPPTKAVVVKNPCPAGQCLSNGICCWKGSPYYCNGYCYASGEEARSASQGRCMDWKIIC